MNGFDITKRSLKYITTSEIREVMFEAVKQWDAKYTRTDKRIVMIKINQQWLPLIEDIIRKQLKNPRFANNFMNTVQRERKRRIDGWIKEAVIKLGWRDLSHARIS